MNKRLKAQAMLRLIRRHARKHGLRIEAIPKKDKGSHTWYAVINSSGTRVDQFALTGHAMELSWPVMRSIEDGLAHLFGEKWMEDR